MLPDLTQTTLTKQLRALEESGLVHRKVYAEVPPRVEYSLTNIAREFQQVINAYRVFGEKYIEQMAGRQDDFQTISGGGLRQERRYDARSG